MPRPMPVKKKHVVAYVGSTSLKASTTQWEQLAQRLQDLIAAQYDEDLETYEELRA